MAASGRNTRRSTARGTAIRSLQERSLAGNGLRPYAPGLAKNGRRAVSWIRRARWRGIWDLAEIPLPKRKRSEKYLGARSAEEVHQAQWRYSAAMQALDGAQGLLELQVAQLSESFGPGLRRKFRFTI